MELNGSRIREARGRLSRAELARRIARHDEKKLGATSAQQVQRWENGQRPRYEAETITAIAKATGVGVDFFYEAERETLESRDEGDPSSMRDLLMTLIREVRELREAVVA